MGWPGRGCFPPWVRSEFRQPTDWRNAEAYAPLLKAERALFAWEWLRRSDAYRAAARSAGSKSNPSREQSGAALWGLHRFEDPSLAAPEARPVWRAERHALVLTAWAEHHASSDEFELHPLKTLATLVLSPSGAERLLLSDGLSSVRMDILRGSILGGTVRLHYDISGLREAEGPLLVLRRLLALWNRGQFAKALHPPESRAARFVLMLRAYDAMKAGASQRDIAAELLDREAGADRWRIRAPTVRSRVQRLVRNAAMMADGGYSRFLEWVPGYPRRL